MPKAANLGRRGQRGAAKFSKYSHS